jgi:hypothetical protein
MARNIQPRTGPSRRSGADRPQDGEKDKEKSAEGLSGIPRRPPPVRPSRRIADGPLAREVEREEDRSEGIEEMSVRVGAAASRGVPRSARIPRISFPLKKTISASGTVHKAQSAEEMLLEYVTPPMQEPILETSSALRLLYALLSKVLPELKGNPNLLTPARAVMDDESRRYSDLRARFNEQGLAA